MVRCGNRVSPSMGKERRKSGRVLDPHLQRPGLESKGSRPEAPWVGSECGFLRVPWRAFSKNDESGGNATRASCARGFYQKGCGAAKPQPLCIGQLPLRKGAREARPYWCELRPLPGARSCQCLPGNLKGEGTPASCLALVASPRKRARPVWNGCPNRWKRMAATKV